MVFVNIVLFGDVLAEWSELSPEDLMVFSSILALARSSSNLTSSEGLKSPMSISITKG